jgi:hypothetical protein
MQWKVRLTIDERLKWIAQMIERQIRQLTRNFAIWSAENIVEPGRDKGIQVSTADGSRFEGRPSHGERSHSVLVLELVGDEATILSTAARNDNVVFAVGFPMPIAQFDKFPLARVPIYVLAFEFGKIASGAYSVLIECNSRALVRNRAFFAKPDFDGQIVLTDYISFLHFSHCSFGTRFGRYFSNVRRSC